MIEVIIITALVIEAITLISRFGFKIRILDRVEKLKQKRKRITRVHHGVWGLVIALIAELLGYTLLVGIGLGVALSDALHHIILWIVTGSLEFKGAIEISKGGKK